MLAPILTEHGRFNSDCQDFVTNAAAIRQCLLRQEPCGTIFVRARTVVFIVSSVAGGKDEILGGPTQVGSVNESRPMSENSTHGCGNAA